MEKETVKLVNVLRRIARAAGYAAWVKSDPEAARFCSRQYNKVLARLTELEPALQPLFTSLDEGASAEVTRIAARELAGYFEDEVSEGYEWRIGRRCGTRRMRTRAYPFAVHCE